MQPLGWLNEPTGIFQMIVGSNVDLPAWAVGPSLSLVVIIIFGIWTFVGFNTVIFLAGLGAIPSELYEAASIDGGSRWAQFRHITLPLLSPTIYFLTLYAVIGTFKAFTHIFVVRTPAALGTADTASVVIFDAIKRDTRYGYAAALAVLLLIIVLLLTAVNNRIASKRVFYG
jgi:multiple sugar transport system permease protein